MAREYQVLDQEYQPDDDERCEGCGRDRSGHFQDDVGTLYSLRMTDCVPCEEE